VIVRFDDFELDDVTLELKRAGTPVKLQQQPARILAILTGHAGELVSRETLRKAIWGDDTFVDFDRGMNYCVSQIRTALGDTAEAPRYIETLRGRGYRFIGTTGGASTNANRPLPRIAIAAAAILLFLLGAAGVWRKVAREPKPAIGVAPLTAPATEKQWADALHAQIVSRLAIASRVPVVDLTRSSASTRWRVEGRVDRSSAQYRVTMLLRDTADDSVRWSDIFAGSPGDWVDAQSEMADRMTEIIRYRIEGPSAGLPKRRAKLPSGP
jgi:DNA-binding winged helix-turn-helix (wHTH) protein/TolB-like protein